MKKAPWALLLTFLACSALPLAADDPAKAEYTLPNVLQVFREEVKPGKQAVHARTEAAWAAASRKAGSPFYYLGATAISGGSESWFFSGFKSFEHWEKVRNEESQMPGLTEVTDRIMEEDGSHLNNARSMTLRLRPELSYWNGFHMGQARYFRVFTVRVKPGHSVNFEEARKLVKAAHEKAKLADSFAVYEAYAGAPIGTWFVFVPAKSGADFDAWDVMHESAAYKEAMGEEGRKRMRALQENSIQMTDSVILRFDPNLSFASPMVTAGDPAFWQPKAEVMAKKPAKASGPKVQPVSKKD